MGIAPSAVLKRRCFAAVLGSLHCWTTRPTTSDDEETGIHA